MNLPLVGTGGMLPSESSFAVHLELLAGAAALLLLAGFAWVRRRI